MPSTASASAASEVPPSGFERKLSSSFQRLRSNSVYHGRTFGTGETSKYDISALEERSSNLSTARSHLYLQRLKSINRRSSHNLSNDEALFFLSLPDKIRRLHFTRQENILIRAACELQLSKHPRYENAYPPQTSWTDGRASTSHSYASSLISRDAMPEPASVPSTPTTSDGRYPSAFSVRTSSLPRTESLVSSNGSILPFNPLACHPPGISRAITMPPSPFDYTKSITTAPDTPSTSTKQYLDEKTRMMIRQCTSSPEAFDEVLTFGYNADEDAPATEPHTPFDFQFDEGLSSPEDMSDDDYFTLDTDDEPWTPGSDSTTATSWDFQSPSLPVQRLDGTYYRAKERPMTLRVTLTKPELKSAMEDSPSRVIRPSKNHYSSLRIQDPLALEQLTFSDDVTGMYGAFAITPTKDSSKMKKLLKRLTSPAF